MKNTEIVNRIWEKFPELEGGDYSKKEMLDELNEGWKNNLVLYVLIEDYNLPDLFYKAYTDAELMIDVYQKTKEKVYLDIIEQYTYDGGINWLTTEEVALGVIFDIDENKFIRVTPKVGVEIEEV